MNKHASVRRSLDTARGALPMAAEVRAGLQRSLLELPRKYFYDDRGSRLFEEITRLPEYYPTPPARLRLEPTRPAGPRVAGVPTGPDMSDGPDDAEVWPAIEEVRSYRDRVETSCRSGQAMPGS